MRFLLCEPLQLLRHLVLVILDLWKRWWDRVLRWVWHSVLWSDCVDLLIRD
jgi:hypothetical protein